jgi:uncharacterized caspase-like protein
MKRALVIGINKYDSGNNLNGCVNDANQVHSLISTNEDQTKNFDSCLMTTDSHRIDIATLKQKMIELFDKEADMAFFYFSGHGAMTSLGGAICTSDAKLYNLGISMSDILTMANQSKIKEVIIILDCCHSGAMGQIPALLNGNQITIREGVSILSASRDSESSYEVNGRGMFTTLVCDGLSGGAADVLGLITPSSIYYHVEQNFGAWDQRPLFKSYVSRSTTLRKGKARIDLETLRAIPQLFLKTGDKFFLDKTFEETEISAKPENVAKFKQLKKLQTVGLISIPHVKPDLYWVAMDGRHCELSPLGKHYYNLAKAGKV